MRNQVKLFLLMIVALFAFSTIAIASVAVIDDGASFVANDANTAITLNPLGGTDAAGATGIDIEITYAVE